MPPLVSHPAIRRVITAEGVSNFGTMLTRLALPWVAALVLQATPLQMAWLLIADVLAAALGGLLLGSWVERSGKRAVMLLADALRLLLMLWLALATWMGWIGFSGLLLVAAANGLLSMAFELARSAWMAQAVPVHDLPRRNAQLSLVGSLSETAAFALGGWLYQWLGAALAFVVDAASYLVSALCLKSVAETPAQPARSARPAQANDSAWRRLWRATALGLRAVADRPRLRALAGVEALGSFSYGLVATVYTIFVTRDLAIPPSQVGMVAAMGGLGAVLGAVLAPRLGLLIGPGRTMTLGMAAFALGGACIPMAGAGWAALVWLVAHQIVADAGHTLHDVHDRTLRQTAVPVALLARADAGIRSAGQIALLAGAVVGGVLGTAVGSRAVLWTAVAAAAAAALVAAWWLAERSWVASVPESR